MLCKMRAVIQMSVHIHIFLTMVLMMVLLDISYTNRYYYNTIKNKYVYDKWIGFDFSISIISIVRFNTFSL